MSAPGSQEYAEHVRRMRAEVAAWHERNGYKPKPPVDPKYGTHVFKSEEWPEYSAQMRLRAGHPPQSEGECLWATLEALNQEGVYAWPGDGTSIVAQMIWAQHKRAEKAESLTRSTGSEASLERVARAIDPKAWAMRDEDLQRREEWDAGIKVGWGDKTFEEWANRFVGKSLEQAKAALDALALTNLDGGGK